MAIDKAWVDKLREDADLLKRDDFVVEGIRIELPMAKAAGSQVHRQWQRRVIEDVLPDSPLADAPEKIPFRILRALTKDGTTKVALSQAFDGQFEPLRAAFYRSGQSNSNIPIAFHVLAVMGAKKDVNDARVLGERMFLLLMRGATGELDQTLVTRYLERFRESPESPGSLDLAQRYLVETLHPDWVPEREFSVDLAQYLDPVVPFMPDAGELFQRDVQNLLDAKLPAADHFQVVNMLLSLHLGLYMPRLALRLNHSLEQLIAGLHTAQKLDIAQIQALETGRARETDFRGRLSMRAPSSGAKRSIAANAPAHTAYRAMTQELDRLHFSLLVFHRLRELTKSYLRATDNITDESILSEMTRMPSGIARLLKSRVGFDRYLMRALEVLCVLFVKEQLDDGEKAHELIEQAQNGLEALYQCYRENNLQTAPGSRTRATRQGLEVVDRLLKSGDSGILRGVRGLGSYFELGVNLVPLLLLTTIGSGGEKIQVAEFWKELAEYGFSFEAEERELLLGHLKSMGLYERFSDAGEASYIRNLLVGV